MSLDLEGCEILPHSSYEHRLIGGTVEATSSESHAGGTVRETAGGLEVSASASDAAKPGLLAKVMGKVTRSRQSETSNRETLKRQERVDLVSTAGQDRWQVGDPRHGDGRKPGGRLFGSYFGEEQDGEGEPKPMCVIAGGASGSSMIIASALVRFGQILVTLGADEASAAEPEDVDMELAGRGHQVQAARRRHERDLRSRVAGLVLAKALHEAERESPSSREGEVLMARQSIALARRGALRDEAG